MSSWTPSVPDLGTSNSRALLTQALKHAQRLEPGIRKARLDFSGESVVLELSPWSWLFRQGKVLETARSATSPWVPEGKSLRIFLRSPW